MYGKIDLVSHLNELYVCVLYFLCIFSLFVYILLGGPQGRVACSYLCYPLKIKSLLLLLLLLLLLNICWLNGEHCRPQSNCSLGAV